MGKKLDLLTLRARKGSGEKVTMVTAYDCPTARLADEAGIDVVLVGDSVGNVVLGYADTRPVTMEEMLHHCRAVSRGVTHALIIGDMPFMSFNVTEAEAIRNAGRFVKEGGADLVKLEGGAAVAATVGAIVRAGIPVCGHLGLTPQTATALGGYKVQGRTAAAARALLADARRLEEAGASMIVIECVPDRVTERITAAVQIPVIGIGAGPACDGQVLVLHDLLGIGAAPPRFVKRYAELGEAIRQALVAYRDDVRSGAFPAREHGFTVPDDELASI
jgi:3-methyl-2-oxobutanoate hydroxymethyltransferase